MRITESLLYLALALAAALATGGSIKTTRGSVGVPAPVIPAAR
jgi:hypothetical protein